MSAFLSTRSYQLGKHTYCIPLYTYPVNSQKLSAMASGGIIPIHHTGAEDIPSCHLETRAELDSLEPGFLSRVHSAVCSRPVIKVQ